MINIAGRTAPHRKGTLNSFLAVLLIMLVSGCGSSPEKAKSFKTIFDHYRDKEDIVAISFPPGLVGIFLNEDNADQAELKKLMQELSAFRMLTVDSGSKEAGGFDSDRITGESGTVSLSKELRLVVTDFTSRNNFQDLFRLQAGGEDMFIRIQEKEGIVRDAILMMHSDETFFVIELKGNISMQHFTRLVESGNLQELTELANIDF